MANGKYGYLTDPRYAEAFPRVYRALGNSKSPLSKARSDYANTYKRAEGVSIQDAFVEADGLIVAAGDDPTEAEQALRREIGKLRRATGRETSFATAEEQTAGESVLSVSGADVAIEREQRMERIKVPNAQIYAAYRSIFGVTP